MPGTNYAPSRKAYQAELVAWLGLTIGGVVAVTIHMDSWLKAILGGSAFVCTSVLAYGTWRKKRGQLPFNETEHKANAKSLGGIGKHVTTKDGRIVEYIVYGSDQEDASVMVQIHGAGSTGGICCQWNDTLFKELNIKGIAPTMPNSGYSDIRPNRKIANFPRDDIAPILRAEGVTDFLVDGYSLGTAHAMAIAWYFGPDHAQHRCRGMGLMCPYLSTAICKEFGFRCDADEVWMIRNNDPREWHAAWNFTLADISNLLPFASPVYEMGHMIWPKVVKTRPWLFPMLAEDCRRTGARGYVGQGYEMFCYVTNSLWGFDPRDIRTQNVAVWWARDDKLSPPEHGRWLAKLFEGRRSIGVRTRNRCIDIGLDHFTYVPSLGPVYQSTEETLPQTLLEMMA